MLIIYLTINFPAYIIWFARSWHSVKKNKKKTYIRKIITSFGSKSIYHILKKQPPSPKKTIIKDSGESKVMKCFDNVRLNLAALDVFAEEVVKVTNYAELWYAKLAWYSPSATRRICRGSKVDELHRTVRYRTRLLHSECHLLDFLLRFGVRIRIPSF